MFLSTYALVDLGLSEGLSSLLVKHARQSQTKKTDILPITFLTETQVNQALAHPQNDSLRDLIATAYHDSVEATYHFNYCQENLEDQRVFIEETLRTFQAKLNQEVSPASKANIESAKEALNQQLRVMQTIQKDADTGQKQIDSLNSEINKLATSHDREWSDFRQEKLEQLKSQLEKLLGDAGLKLLPGEIDNLERQDLQEVMDRYIDLGVSKDLPEGEMDRLLGLKEPDFATYFKMKAYMAIRSTHPTPDQSAKLMKQLSSFFEETREKAQQIDTRQKEENHVIHQEVQPVVQTAKNNSKELQQLKQERDVLLTRVTSLQDLEVIREKIEQRSEVKPQPGTNLHI